MIFKFFPCQPLLLLNPLCKVLYLLSSLHLKDITISNTVHQQHWHTVCDFQLLKIEIRLQLYFYWGEGGSRGGNKEHSGFFEETWKLTVLARMIGSEKKCSNSVSLWSLQFVKFTGSALIHGCIFWLCKSRWALDTHSYLIWDCVWTYLYQFYICIFNTMQLIYWNSILH